VRVRGVRHLRAAARHRPRDVSIVVAVTLGAVLAVLGVTLLASRLASSSLEFLQHRRSFAAWIAVGLLAVTLSVD
jgi:hypothetical protein